MCKIVCKPFCRYPGGKSRHVKKILKYFTNVRDYREPFLGGGSVFLAGGFKNAWLNDIDPGVVAMWQLVKEDPEYIENLINKHTLILDHKSEPEKVKKAIDLWRHIKNDIDEKLVPLGYRELFLIKTCFNGVKTGGPTGGIKQKSQWTITARWSPQLTIRRVYSVHKLLQSCKITNYSWEHVVESVDSGTCLFLDPPYLEKGPVCYKYSFDEEQHKNLAEILVSKKCKFVVTLDNCSKIKNIWNNHFSSNNFMNEEWRYSMKGSREVNKMGKELFVINGLDLNELKP